MPFQTLGFDGTSIAAVDPTHKAMHAARRPKAVSSFSCGTGGSTGSPGAGLSLAAFKWSSQAKLALIRRVRIGLMTTAGVTGGPPELGLYITRAYTVNPSSAGVTASFAGNNQKNRSSQPPSEMVFGGGVLTFNQTGITTGTRTVDALPILSVMNTIAISDPAYAEFGGNVEDQPLVLYPNEGLELQNVIAASAGLYRWDITFEWDEILLADWIG